MADKDLLVRALLVNGDAVASVLDSYKEQNPRLSPATYCQVVKDVKSLNKALQTLEKEHDAGNFQLVKPRATDNIAKVLDECGQLAKGLLLLMRNKTLHDDISLSQEITTLVAEIAFFRRTYGKNKDILVSELTQSERRELYDLSKFATSML